MVVRVPLGGALPEAPLVVLVAELVWEVLWVVSMGMFTQSGKKERRWKGEEMMGEPQERHDGGRGDSLISRGGLGGDCTGRTGGKDKARLESLTGERSRRDIRLRDGESLKRSLGNMSGGEAPPRLAKSRRFSKLMGDVGESYNEN